MNTHFFAWISQGCFFLSLNLDCSLFSHVVNVTEKFLTREAVPPTWDAHLKSIMAVSTSSFFSHNTHMHRGRESTSCAHTFNTTSEGQDTHVRLKGHRPPSHLSPIPDMLIPAVVAGRRGGDRLEVSVSRCAHAVRPCQKTAIREGLERKQLLFWGIWREVGIEVRD